MKTMAMAVAALAAFLGACGGGASGDGVTGGACGAPTVLFSGFDSYDSLAVQGGFVYVELPGEGVARCATTGCTAPTSVVDNDGFVSSAFGGTSIAYATQIASSDDDGVSGAIRSANDDGTNDQSVQSNLTYPAYVAKSGASMFWAQDSFAIDETPATINCIGCNGNAASTPWFAGLTGGTYGMIADDENVYVLADDPTQTSVMLFSCSVNAPCYGEPRVVIGDLDPTITAQQIATDGTNVYVARASSGDIVRVDPSGNVTRVAAIDAVSAIVVDASTSTLYYGTQAGLIARVALDGSAQSATIACSASAIASLDVDATNVYALTGDSQSDVAVAKK